MTNTDLQPDVVICRTETPDGKFTHGLSSGVESVTGASDHVVEILEPRAVPLGGPRAMTVQRVLPQRARSLIGAFCFLDFYGPDDVSVSGGMHVPRHPHTGLATVSWLFEGRINHIDSAGNWATVRPGEVNLMNAGSGITHSEISTDDTTVLHAVQLWYAFPDHARFSEPGLDVHEPQTVTGDGWRAKVFMGSLLGETSPIRTHIPLTAAEIRLDAGANMVIDIPEDHEHGVLAVEGTLNLDGADIQQAEVGYVGTGVRRLVLTNTSDHEALALLIGGEPLHEEIVMWWNFVGRSHEEIATWRAAYQQEMGFETPDHRNPLDKDAGRGDEPLGSPVSGDLMDGLIGTRYTDGRHFPQYGNFPPDEPAPLPAPELPNTRIKPRRNPSTTATRESEKTTKMSTQNPDRSQATVDNPVVVQEPTRYAIYVDADSQQPAGFTLYADHHADDGRTERIFPHTEVGDEYAGQGLASTLVRAALDDTVAQGAKIVALCPYVKNWISKHEDYEQYQVRATQAHIDTLQAGR